MKYCLHIMMSHAALCLPTFLLYFVLIFPVISLDASFFIS
uniref:Uncharacterized protein n=1 Tax=Arundo donax TaxID=35708 RepID=A0A0A9GYT8_ARUDO